MKSVVITGSTRGIGRGLAEQFLKRDCRVTVSGRKQADVDTLVAELAASYGADRVAGAACDITDASQIQQLWDAAMAAFGSVDVWVNNAGMSIRRQTIDLVPASDIKRIIDTNLTGVLNAASIVGAGMKAQGHGQIWNMEGFGSGGQAQPGMLAYGATKRAVNYINKAMRKDMKGTGVQVCSLSPGIVITDLLMEDYDQASPEWEKAKKIFNILGDKVETVTPYLVDGILKANKDGASVAWLTGPKAFGRFMTAGFKKRDLFAD